MQRVLYIFTKQYPWDVRVEKICSSLKNFDFDVSILARWVPDQRESEISSGFKISRVGFNKSSAATSPISLNPVWRKKIEEVIQEAKPDLIISRDIMVSSATADIAHKYSIPVLMDMAEHYPAAMRGWKKYQSGLINKIIVNNLRIPDLVEKNSVRRMDGIITVCEEQTDRLNREYSFDKDRMTVVHNTPDLNFFNDGKSGSNNPPRIFSHHGFLSAEKSIENFLQGFILAAKIDPNIEFLVSGDGESYPDILALTNQSEVKNRIHIRGGYNFRDLNKILSNVDIGIIPYQVSDFNNYTIHNKIFDYMALGKPVIVSEAIPMARIVRETGCGIVVDCSKPEIISEAILNLKNLNLDQLSSNGLQYSREKYNWSVDSIQLIDFIKKSI